MVREFVVAFILLNFSCLALRKWMSVKEIRLENWEIGFALSCLVCNEWGIDCNITKYDTISDTDHFVMFTIWFSLLSPFWFPIQPIFFQSTCLSSSSDCVSRAKRYLNAIKYYIFSIAKAFQSTHIAIPLLIVSISTSTLLSTFVFNLNIFHMEKRSLLKKILFLFLLDRVVLSKMCVCFCVC